MLEGVRNRKITLTWTCWYSGYKLNIYRSSGVT